MHNSYLEVLAELGVPALLAFLGFLAASGSATRVAIARSERRATATGCGSGSPCRRRWSWRSSRAPSSAPR